MAQDLASSILSFNNLLDTQIPAHFSGYDPADAGNWLSSDKIRESLDLRIEELQEAVDEKKAKVERMQAFYHQLTDDIMYDNSKSLKYTV